MADLEALFQEFHRNNPRVYEELVKLAKQAKAKGYRHVGIKMLWEVVRWNRMIQARCPTGDYKLNNNLHSRYARFIMENEPELAGFFRVRRLQT